MSEAEVVDLAEGFQEFADAVSAVVRQIGEILGEALCEILYWFKSHPTFIATVRQLLHRRDSHALGWTEDRWCIRCRTWPLRLAWWRRIEATYALQ
jgi:hypothetical protein